MLDALGAFDPGSNPGRPTILLEGEVHRQNVVAKLAEGGANELVHTRIQPRDLIFLVLKC